jgi:RNAse (barnase) inhibitor barstar
MQQEIIIDGNRITSIASFYEEINRVFMTGEDWQLGNSLDAFNDLLYGGFGAIKSHEPVTILWKNMDKSRQALGDAATRQYYEEKLLPESPFDKAYFREKLQALKEGKGPTYFDLLLEIIADHPDITLRSID